LRAVEVRHSRRADLAVLDYISDQVCLFYGKPAVYGIVSKPHGVRVGINIYLNGFIPDENIRFRDYQIRFHLSPSPNEWRSSDIMMQWPNFKRSMGDFTLDAKPGSIYRGQVIGIVGANGDRQDDVREDHSRHNAADGGQHPPDRSPDKLQAAVCGAPRPQSPCGEILSSIDPSILADQFLQDDGVRPRWI